MNPHFKKSRPSLPKSRLIIGRKPLLEALEMGKTIEKIFILQSAGGDEITQIKRQAKNANIAVSLVPAEKLTRFTTTNHQGVIAISGLIEYQNLQNIINLLVDDGKVPLIVVLDGITDTRNLGAIARSAYCFGADALVLPSSNNAAVTDEAVKTSAGALEALPVCRVPSVEQAMDTLHLNGIATIATSLQTGNTLQNIDLQIPLAIIMGAEDKGISNYVIKNALHLVKIPMSDKFDSLNVSVAAGVMLYEVFKQRLS